MNCHFKQHTNFEGLIFDLCLINCRFSPFFFFECLLPCFQHHILSVLFQLFQRAQLQSAMKQSHWMVSVSICSIPPLTAKEGFHTLNWPLHNISGQLKLRQLTLKPETYTVYLKMKYKIVCSCHEQHHPHKLRWIIYLSLYTTNDWLTAHSALNRCTVQATDNFYHWVKVKVKLKYRFPTHGMYKYNSMIENGRIPKKKNLTWWQQSHKHKPAGCFLFLPYFFPFLIF